MPGHSFDTFEDLALQGTTFEPRPPHGRAVLARDQNTKTDKAVISLGIGGPTKKGYSRHKQLAEVIKTTWRRTYKLPSS